MENVIFACWIAVVVVFVVMMMVAWNSIGLSRRVIELERAALERKLNEVTLFDLVQRLSIAVTEKRKIDKAQTDQLREMVKSLEGVIIGREFVEFVFAIADFFVDKDV